MFLECFKHPKVSQELSKIYQIDFNQPKIELDSNKFEITPLLIIHFLQVMKAIVRKGLKKSYYPIEQNLNAKVKGKINIGKTLKHNIFKGQNHKTVCHYQEFGINCAENRLLKKALKFVQSYLAKSDIKTDDKLKQTLAYCLAPFELVSDNIEIREMKSFKNNAFFKDYAVAIKLAKMILKRFAYNLQNTDTKNLTPPFWIDMSLLFEKYVYALLLENNAVKYQFEYTDFLIDDIVIDSKYKTIYKNNDVNDDIAQLARYGRNKVIRKALNLDEKIAKCLIIYPNKIGKERLDKDLWQQAEEIKAFKVFKKIAVKLPSFDT
jgi:5-methylcytosine-specific restriction endonuclease McrBC regulatory subunit McrC